MAGMSCIGSLWRRGFSARTGAYWAEKCSNATGFESRRGRHMRAVLRNAIAGLGARRLAAGALVLIVSFAAALWALDVLFPRAASRPPKLAATAPLKAATRVSTVTAPIAVALTAIRDTMERQGPPAPAAQLGQPPAETRGKGPI